MARLSQADRHIALVVAIAAVALVAVAVAAGAVTGNTPSDPGGALPPLPGPTLSATAPIVASPVRPPLDLPEAPVVPNPGRYDLCGVVAAVTPGTADRLGAILVYGRTGVTCDRGLAAITPSTGWFRLDATGALQAIDPPVIDKALIDARVAVTYDGAVAESYPVQGSAAVVVLLP
jgi:hypothetical protein